MISIDYVRSVILECREDVLRISSVTGEINLAFCVIMWLRHSRYLCAKWLALPATDKELIECIDQYDENDVFYDEMDFYDDEFLLSP